MTSPIRLIAIDIDGTLLDSQFQIPPANISALRRAHVGGPGRVPLPGVDHLLHDADYPDTPAPAVLDALHRFVGR